MDLQIARESSGKNHDLKRFEHVPEERQTERATVPDSWMTTYLWTTASVQKPIGIARSILMSEKCQHIR